MCKARPCGRRQGVARVDFARVRQHYSERSSINAVEPS
jgi:hypothetical protein